MTNDREARIAVECGYHPVGITDTEVKIWLRIIELEHIKEGIDHFTRDLHVLKQILDFQAGDFQKFFWKKSRAVIKGKLTREINKWKHNLRHAKVLGTPATKESRIPPDVMNIKW